MSGDAPAAVVFGGEKDHLIPVATVERFKAAMEKARVRCSVHVYPGKGTDFSMTGAGRGMGITIAKR